MFQHVFCILFLKIDFSDLRWDFTSSPRLSQLHLHGLVSLPWYAGVNLCSVGCFTGTETRRGYAWKAQLVTLVLLIVVDFFDTTYIYIYIFTYISSICYT